MQSEIGEDLKELALSLGYAWPDDDEGRWRCLKTMASRAAYWRSEAGRYSTEMLREVEKERLYSHQHKRMKALARKVTNLRRALKEFMTSQMACIREARAEISSK